MSKTPPSAGATSIFDFAKDPFVFLDETARTLGDVVRIPFPTTKPVYLVSHPDDIQQILVRDRARYKKDMETQKLCEFLGTGLLTSDGEFWKRQRRLAQPAFHHQSIRSYATSMRELTELELESWQSGQERDLHDDMMRLTLAIVAQTLMGADVSDRAADIGNAIETIMDHVLGIGGTGIRFPSYIPTPGNLRAKQAIETIDEVLVDLIARRRADEREGHDLLSMLLAARDDDGSAMTDQQLRDEVITMFLAGHETTALALSYSWYLLSKHPLVAERLRQEIDDVLGDREIEFEDLKSLPYANAIVQESMRLYPPAWAIGREPLEDVELGGYHIPEGAQLFIAQSVVHRDPRWFRNPEAFQPQRWLEGREIPKFAYFPFGGGARICIGKSFAMMEAVIILVTIARRFELDLRRGYRLERVPSITARPKAGLPMSVIDRERILPRLAPEDRVAAQPARR